MSGYLLKRSMQNLVLLWLVSIIGFGVLYLAPGGPLAQFALVPGMSQAELIKIATQMGLNRPIPAQYWEWFTRLLGGGKTKVIELHSERNPFFGGVNPEPIPPNHRLWSTPNLIISPHTAADDTATYNERSLDIFLDNLRALRDGRPLPNRYDIERGY